jgi:hypothetical protein
MNHLWTNHGLSVCPEATRTSQKKPDSQAAEAPDNGSYIVHIQGPAHEVYSIIMLYIAGKRLELPLALS